MKKLITYLFFVSVVGLTSCANEADPVADKSFFTKFYDKSNFNVNYTPLDAVQTSDGGYLILALERVVVAEGNEVLPPTIYLLKTDEFGEFVSELDLGDDLTLPAPSLLNVGGKFYFFCMTSGFSTQLIEVSEAGQIAQQIEVGGTYPLAAAVDGSNMLLLNFDNSARETRMSVITTEGKVFQGKSKAFTIGAGEGPEEQIINSIYRTGRQFPFQVGKANNLYYFNGFYDYTMSVVFTDLTADAPISLLAGQQDDGFVTQLYSLAGGKYATARSNFGDNYILPPAQMPTTGQIYSLGGLSFPELVPYAPVKIVNVKIGETDKILFGSNTRGKQIVLLGYNTSDGTFSGSRYLGFSNAFELASLTPTADNGLLVVGTTYIAGRFPRICLFKLSAEALSESFQK